MPKARKPRGSRYAPYLRAATNVALSAYRGYSKTKTHTKSKDAQAFISGQHDSWMLYRRKSRPKYQRKRWKSFKRKVQWVNAQQKPRSSIVNTHLALPTCTNNQQAVYWVPMYSGFSSVGDPNQDLKLITDVAMESTDNNVRKAGALVNLQSALLESTIYSGHTVPVYVDVYYMIAKRSGIDFGKFYNDGLEMADTAGDADENKTLLIGSECNYNTLGITPFQSTAICRNFTILKKRRILLTPGGTIQLKWSDPKNHIYKMNAHDSSVTEDVTDPVATYGGNGFIKYLTKGFLFQFYTVPGTVSTEKSQAITSGQIRITSYKNFYFSTIDQGASRKLVNY